MKRGKSNRAVVPGRVLAWPLACFALPAGLTLILALTSAWPRDIAPGSGLKLAGLMASLLVTVLVWRIAVASVQDVRVRRIAAVLTAMVGLLAWPLWSLGVLPSVNGAVLQQPQTVQMVLERLEATPQRHSREFHHWALLAPLAEGTQLAGGRYYLTKATHDRLSAEAPDTVELQIATGLLGSVVVVGIQ